MKLNSNLTSAKMERLNFLIDLSQLVKTKALMAIFKPTYQNYLDF
jgi:hypothetical protein